VEGLIKAILELPVPFSRIFLADATTTGSAGLSRVSQGSMRRGSQELRHSKGKDRIHLKDLFNAAIDLGQTQFKAMLSKEPSFRSTTVNN
jgi:hypothetical protein